MRQEIAFRNGYVHVGRATCTGIVGAFIGFFSAVYGSGWGLAIIIWLWAWFLLSLWTAWERGVDRAARLWHEALKRDLAIRVLEKQLGLPISGGSFLHADQVPADELIHRGLIEYPTGVEWESYRLGGGILSDTRNGMTWQQIQ